MYGDIHQTRRAALGVIPYSHFGVELPGGQICENSPYGVRLVPFADFSRGQPTQVTNPEDGAAERAETVHRAMSRVGERRYDIASNNCEHFATWCATGVAISHQVIAFAQMIASLIKAAAITLAAVLALSAAEAAFAE
jgi:uncharacterized protein YycO